MIRFTAILFIMLMISCEKEPYTIEYQNGYPNRLAGVWIAYEYYNGDINNAPYSEYELVTALDPNSDSLIVANLYASGLRVKAKIDSNTFHTEKGNQLEIINNPYKIQSISLNGELNANDIHDALIINATYFDNFNAVYDSVLIIALRKTGFEDSEQYNL